MQILPRVPSRLAYAIGALILAWIIGTTVFHFVEHWGWLDSAFFSTSTLTTVGYGDITARTNGNENPPALLEGWRSAELDHEFL